MAVKYGNAPIPKKLRVWVCVKMRPSKWYNRSALDSSCALSGNDMKHVWEHLKKQYKNAVAGYTYPNEVGICMVIDKYNVYTQDLLSEVVSIAAMKANQVHFAMNPIGFAAGKVQFIPAVGRLLVSNFEDDLEEVLPTRKLDGLEQDIVTLYRKKGTSWEIEEWKG